MEESNEVSLIKIAVVLVGVVLLLSASAALYQFYNTKIKDVQLKEIENRKKQNQSINYNVPTYEIPNVALVYAIDVI